jgi:hypothetical protein
MEMPLSLIRVQHQVQWLQTEANHVDWTHHQVSRSLLVHGTSPNIENQGPVLAICGYYFQETIL